MRTLRAFVFATSVLTSMAGCDEPADRPSEIQSLRVLAVRSEQPFPKPGSEPLLEMLLEDRGAAAVLPDGGKRPVQVLWLAPCVNPPGDLFYACYPALQQAAMMIGDDGLRTGALPSGAPAGLAGFGLSFSPAIPPNVITSHPRGEGVVHPFGVVYVFFAACAGELRSLPSADVRYELPIGCFRPGTDQALGQADFEFGFYPLYVYDDVSNANPPVVRVDFVKAAGGACGSDGSCEAGTACGKEGLCLPVVPACREPDEDDCPSHAINPVLGPSPAEKAVTARLGDDAPLETVWVDYYATAGSFDKDARVIHDVESGYADEYYGAWRANAPVGTEVRLYAVVRDNRDGVTWKWQDVIVGE